jgi:hypothetical protein
MKITRNDWWITPVWEIQTDFDHNFNQQLLQEINDYFNSLPKGDGFNTNIWLCPGESVKILKETTLKIIKDETHSFIAPNYTDFEYWHTRGWLNYNLPGRSMPIHGHGGNKIAMTYYINAPEHCGDLQIIDPRGAIDWDNGTDGVNGTKFKRIKPTESKLVFFPSYLLHQVEQNDSDQPRISLTSNISTLDSTTIKTLKSLCS